GARARATAGAATAGHPVPRRCHGGLGSGGGAQAGSARGVGLARVWRRRRTGAGSSWRGAGRARAWRRGGVAHGRGAGYLTAP
ncbi:unnamed protein product, partial [Urochloa humidicola]